jgi:hypothetical protein
LIVLKKPSPPESNQNASRRLLRCCLIAFCCLAAGLPASVRGQVSSNQARKLIATMPGLELKPKVVHVLAVRSIDAATVEASAEIAMAFRLEQSSPGQWRVLEFRTGQDQWQGIELIRRALKVSETANPCDVPDLAVRKQKPSDPTIKRARCLLAELLGVQLPSDDVRIKAVSSMALPFSSKPSAMVEALVAAEFRFQRQNGSWGVASLKTGSRDWVDAGAIFGAVNVEKVNTARADLESLAKALEVFRVQRGAYVESKSETVLVDFLNPRYLPRVIRLDPWHRPYFYEGTRDHYALSSSGPDRKANTGDDIVLNGPVHSASR